MVHWSLKSILVGLGGRLFRLRFGLILRLFRRRLFGPSWRKRGHFSLLGIPIGAVFGGFRAWLADFPFLFQFGAITPTSYYRPELYLCPTDSNLTTQSSHT